MKLAYNDYYDGYDADANAGISNAAGVVMNCLSVLSEVNVTHDRKKHLEHKHMTKEYARNNPYATKKPIYAPKKNFDGLALSILQVC